MSDGNIATRIQTYEDGAQVAYVTIERAEKLNALNQAQAIRLTNALVALSDNTNLRAVVLTGAGDRAFMGGADVQELRVLNPETGRSFIRTIHDVCEAIRSCPVPVVGRVNGFCLGAGMEIAAACDFRICAESAVFGMPEVQVGLPSVVEAALLPMLIGWGRTRWLVLTGQSIDATTAYDWGFVEFVVSLAELDQKIEQTVDTLVQAAPQAVRTQKLLTRRWETHSINDAIELGVDAFEKACHGDEPRRYVDAMLARKHT
jgi:enoyl-CoA hydratase